MGKGVGVVEEENQGNGEGIRDVKRERIRMRCSVSNRVRG